MPPVYETAILERADFLVIYRSSAIGCGRLARLVRSSSALVFMVSSTEVYRDFGIFEC